MKTIATTILAGCFAVPAIAQDSRTLDAHEHGLSTVQIAVEGGMMSLSLEAPGMDIVGFEYAPSTEADTAAVAAAIDLLGQHGAVVTLPDAAGCSLTSATAALETEEHHDEYHADHAHDEHAEHDGEEGHAKGAAHSAFHASHVFDCTAPAALTSVTFSFFDQFPNAQKIAVQYVTDAGAGSAAITRDAPDLTLE